MAIEWTYELPVGEPTAPHLVYAVRSGASLHALLLDRVLGTQTHWVEAARRTQPCLGAECKNCPDPYRRWKGYVCAAISVRDAATGKPVWRPVTLELTEAAAGGLYGYDDRPLAVLVSRAARGTRGAVRLTVMNPQPPAEQLPRIEVWDPEPILRRMWGVRDQKQGRQILLPFGQSG